MTHNEISGIVIEVAIEIHKKLGPGLLESVYQKIMVFELRKRGLTVEEEVLVPVLWNGIVVDEGFRADFIVEGKVMVELKSVETIPPVYKKKLLTQLRLSQLKLGLLINFGQEYLKDGLFRVVNGLHEGE